MILCVPACSNSLLCLIWKELAKPAADRARLPLKHCHNLGGQSTVSMQLSELRIFSFAPLVVSARLFLPNLEQALLIARIAVASLGDLQRFAGRRPKDVVVSQRWIRREYLFVRTSLGDRCKNAARTRAQTSVLLVLSTDFRQRRRTLDVNELARVPVTSHCW